MKNVLDTSGDLSIVQSKKNANSGYWHYADSFTYNAAGAVTSMQLGNGRWESTVFNSRLQPTQIALGTVQGGTDKLDLDYTYGSTANNGNVQTQDITVKRSGQSDLVFNQTYTYDELNRLKIAEEKTGTTTNWKQTFTFDRYGNRRFDESNTTFPASFSNPNLTNPTFNASNNRMASGQNWTYDAAGNVTVDPEGRTFTYDAENKQVEAKNSSSATLGTYYFDGDGKRVKKVVPSTGETTIFVYDAGAKLIAEYSTNLSTTPNVQYQTADNLGTPRINTDANGNILSRTDYMPYGEEIVGLGGRSSTDQYVADDVRQGFTGYIKDEETGLDFAQARMYHKRLGRFSSTDPLYSTGRIERPSSWNRYVYVLNNPLILIDPLGLYEFGASLQDDHTKSVEENARRKSLREKFSAGLDRAKKNLDVIKERYGTDSEQFKEAKRGVEVYGNEGDKGVVVELGTPGRRANAGAEVGPNKDSNGNAVLIIDEPTLNKDIRSLQSLIGHEGIHLDNVRSGNRIGEYEAEFAGNFVQSLLGESENIGMGFAGNVSWTQRGLDGGILFDPAWGTMTWPIRAMLDPSSTLDVRINPSEERRRSAIDAVLQNPTGYNLTKPK